MGRSWDDLYEKNKNELDLLDNILAEINCFGCKTIFAFDAKEINLDSLRLFQVDESSFYTKAFKNYAYYLPIKKIDTHDYCAISFGRTKYAYEIYNLVEGDLTQMARQKFWKSNTTVKLKSEIPVLVFDGLVHDRLNNILFVLIDNKRFSFDESASDMCSHFMAFLEASFPGVAGCEPIDLFPLIEGIYNRSSEGLVHRLAFECSTGVSRDEKLKTGQLDLRDEGYHVSGKAAIGGKVSPYKIGITWTTQKNKGLRSQVCFELHGQKINLHKQGGIFFGAATSYNMFDELCFNLKRIGLYV
ncbi:hypothetical protein CH06BL_21980 [Chromobacterium haemolyticum]|nr:hypothetical protein CH06BL_21980 [Chromobacterium haemolyticum]